MIRTNKSGCTVTNLRWCCTASRGIFSICVAERRVPLARHHCTMFFSYWCHCNMLVSYCGISYLIIFRTTAPNPYYILVRGPWQKLMITPNSTIFISSDICCLVFTWLFCSNIQYLRVFIYFNFKIRRFLIFYV